MKLCADCSEIEFDLEGVNLNKRCNIQDWIKSPYIPESCNVGAGLFSKFTYITVPLVPSDCALCQAIRAGIEREWVPQFRKALNGSLPNEFGCEILPDLTWMRHDEDRGMQRKAAYERQFSGMYRYHLTVLYLPDDKPWVSFQVFVCDVVDGQPCSQFSGRKIETDQVSFDRLREWLSLCEERHASYCDEPRWHMSNELASTLRLIDIDQRVVREVGERDVEK